MGLCMGKFQEPFSHTFIIVNTTALTIDYHIQISGKSHVLLYRAENGREKVDGNGFGRNPGGSHTDFETYIVKDPWQLFAFLICSQCSSRKKTVENKILLSA